MYEHPEKILRAKELRKNMPSAEKIFWHAINFGKLGVKFRRQQPLGKYFVDFICLEKKFVIELDGDQHARDADYDNRRTDFIKSQGYELIRIPNGYIYEQIDDVVHHLKQIIDGIFDANYFFKDKY